MNDQATETKPEPKAARGPNPENVARLEHVLKRTAAEPGVRSPTLAKELNITALSCSQLIDRLVKKGEIQLRKVEGGVRTYYPKGFDMSTLPPIEPPAPKAKKTKKDEAAATEEPTGECSIGGEDDGGEDDGGEDDGL